MIGPSAADAEDAAEREKAEKAEKDKQEREKEEKKPCPFGCRKARKNINNHSVKVIVLQKCPMRAGNEQKLVGFSRQKKRG